MTGWQDRIVGEAMMNPKELRENPRNWRVLAEQGAELGTGEETTIRHRVVVRAEGNEVRGAVGATLTARQDMVHFHDYIKPADEAPISVPFGDAVPVARSLRALAAPGVEALHRAVHTLPTLQLARLLEDHLPALSTRNFTTLHTLGTLLAQEGGAAGDRAETVRCGAGREDDTAHVTGAVGIFASRVHGSLLSTESI